MSLKDNKQIKVIMFLRNHFTNDSRVLKEAQSLGKNGYDVTVLCLRDAYLPRYEVLEHCKVIRAIKAPRTFPNLFLKLYFLLLFSAYCIFMSRKYDILHAHDLEMLPSSILGKWISLNRKKVVYDSHEYQTEKNNTNKKTKFFICLIEKFFISYADEVIVVSDSIGYEYKKLYSIKKPITILNCPKYTKIKENNKFREKYNIKDNAIIFLYQGGLFPNRGIENIYEVFKENCYLDKVCVFMGYGPLKDEIKSLSKDFDNIFFHEAVDPDVLVDYTSSADVGILLYENTCLNHYFCLPNKIFEYTMAGLPVIVSNLHEISNFVKTHENGFVLLKNDKDSLKKTIKKISSNNIDEMKISIPQLQKKYNWNNQEKKLLEIYDFIVGEN
jgi:glycosyltransferase involved in cell wall biosynthesis